MPEVDTPVPFPRRMMAVLYDAIAVFTVVYFLSFIPVVAAGRIIEPGNPFMSAYVVAVVYGYFVLCWTRGRTLGMQAWKLVILAQAAERRPTLAEASLRFLGAAASFALGGAGYLAALFDRDKRAWHDRWSHTRLLLRVTARDGSKTRR
ncbi:MAG: RDD family protein [Gammaproteobacteria bacterium]|nr:RDD family protein [Gammaproteobacteria bacterium]